MKTWAGKLWGWLSLAALLSFNVTAATYYVNVSNTAPASPFTTWATAATNIQDAIAVAADGDLVLVTNGLYRTGGTTAGQTITNRVAITNAVTVQSVNGPEVTIIQGYQVPGTTNGASAVRCVFLTANAVLSGFTLTNGATQASGLGGGINCVGTNILVTNCIISGNAASINGGGVNGPGLLLNCQLVGNIAGTSGGGCAGAAKLSNCILAGNKAVSGGGSYFCTLTNCLLVSNAASGNGAKGGGAYWGTLYGCTLASNSVSGTSISGGGGAANGVLHSCILTQNSSSDSGGAVVASTLYNCTIVGNTSGGTTGTLGTGSSAWNSIIVFNKSSVTLSGEGLTNCCYDSLTNGLGMNNITMPPVFVNLAAGDFRLASNCPCINRGLNEFVKTQADRDGNPRIYGDAVDIGAFENQQVNQVNSTYTYYVNASNATPVPPYVSWETAATNIQDAIDVAFPNQTVLVTNGIYMTGGRLIDGVATTNRVVIAKELAVQSVNGPETTLIQGYQMPSITNGSSSVRCVYIGTNAVLSGFTLTNGSTFSSGGGIYCAATNTVITNCVIIGNAANFGGGGFYGQGWLKNCQLTQNNGRNGNGGGAASADIVFGNTLHLVNCTLAGNSAWYGGGASGAWLTNCVLITNTASQAGGGASEGTLLNCSLTGNISGYSGGGADSAAVVGCVLTGNRAVTGGGAYCCWSSIGITNCIFISNSANQGGGVSLCDAYNCVFTGNYATNSGGAAREGRLFNCTIVSNTAGASCGGAYQFAGSSLNNSILYYNIAPASPNYSGGIVSNCCVQAATQIPYYITNEPAFVDWANADFHLQSNSPCINAGNNASVGTMLDLDGNPRIAGGTVDIGAYEFQSPASTLSYAWAQKYGLPNDGSADSVDYDGDGLNNLQEWKSGTVPTNAVSVLKMSAATNDLSGMVVTWQSVSGITYFLDRSPDLAGGFTSLVSNLVGQAGSTSYTDVTATNAGPYFYRVGVQ